MKKLLSVIFGMLIVNLSIAQQSKCTITSTYIKTNASCNGVANGSIVVTPTSGTGPFTYRIGTIGVFGPSNSFTNLKPGKYTVSIRGTGGCAGITPQITIDPSSSLNAGITKTDPVCFGSATGSITLTPSGGTSPFLYKLGTVGGFVTNSTFTGLKAGKILAYIKDANGCVASANITLINPAPLAFTFTSTDAVCYNSHTGSITVTPTNGTAPYSYKLNATGVFGSSNVLSNLKAGTYTVFVKDASGCEANQMVTIGQNGKLSSCISVDDATCNGASDGLVTINGSGGTGPYLYKLENKSSYSSSNTISGVMAGTYKAFVQDANGCVSTTMIIVGEPVGLTLTATKTDATCIGAADGSITVTANGGTLPYDYKISSSTLFTTSTTFNGLVAGTYRVYVRDNNGCLTSILVTVSENNVTCPPIAVQEKLIVKADPIKPSTFEVSLVPNPSNDRFTVVTKTAGTEVVSLKVVDLNGKNVYVTKGFPQQQFKFGEQLAPGMYLIEVRQGHNVKTVKALKVK